MSDVGTVEYYLLSSIWYGTAKDVYRYRIILYGTAEEASPVYLSSFVGYMHGRYL
jgi:hypothetical protein